ncbi:MAG: hypothetical protein ACXQS8_03685, partial [Candidatus Helarchaeales archaeon]
MIAFSINRNKYFLSWTTSDDELENLRMALVIRCSDWKQIGTVSIYRPFEYERVFLNVELMGEEEFDLDPINALIR